MRLKNPRSLANQEFVATELIIPAVDAIYRSGFLSDIDANILRRAAKLGSIKSSDIESIWKDGASRTTIAKHINRLKESGFIRPIRDDGREYEICFEDNQLTRMTLEYMDKAGLLPIRVD